MHGFGGKGKKISWNHFEYREEQEKMEDEYNQSMNLSKNKNKKEGGEEGDELREEGSSSPISGEEGGRDQRGGNMEEVDS